MSENTRKEILFLPFKASAWNSMEPAWKAAMADPDWDVYVIPIPWYYRNIDGSLCSMRRKHFPIP